MRPAQLLTVLEREFQAAVHGQHTPVMLWGAPGVGKSQMVAQVAEHHGMPVIDIRLSQMEPSDLRGIPFRVDDRVERRRDVEVLRDLLVERGRVAGEIQGVQLVAFTVQFRFW